MMQPCQLTTAGQVNVMFLLLILDHWSTRL